MRRIVFSAFFAAFAILATATITPALAHDGGFAASSDGDKDRDKDARSEAAQLTDEIKAAGARPGKQPAIQAAVSGKAERRRDLMNRLADTNPAAVLELALTPSERAALPANVRSTVEERVTVDGELVVLHHDYEDGHSAYESKLVKGGHETPVKFGSSLGQARPGDQVKTSGVALAGEETVVTDQMVVVQSVNSVGSTGNQHTAVILVMAPGVASHTYANTTNTASLFFDATVGAKSARAFYLEASYGQTTITGANGGPGSASDVYGPYSIPASSCDTSTIRSQAFAAADPTLDFNAYHRIVLSIVNPACGGGVGTIRTQGVGTYDGNSQRVSVSWDFNNALGATTLNGKVGSTALHEYGHNVGVWHANSLECGSVAISSGTCYSDEYGDPSDVMGNSGGYGHLNGAHKDILGWLGARAQIASSNGNYTLNPYEDGTSNVKVLKVPRTRDGSGNVNGYYYLEYRKPTANWNTYAATRPDYANGVLVHTSGLTPLCTSTCNPDYTGSGGGGDSNIVDTHPATIAGTSDFNDAPLKQGQSYADTGSGVTMQVTSTLAGGAAVNLAFTTPQRSIQTIVYPDAAGTISGGGVFAPGQSVTLTASPAGCFQNWRENRSSQSFPNPYTFTVTGDRTLEAVFTSASCTAPPANDNFPGTTVTTGQQSVNTSGATTQSGEPVSLTCSGAAVPTGRTAWYTIMPATTSQITLTTVGSTIDTVLGVFTGNAVNGLTMVTCNDDMPDVTTSQVQFTGQAGTSYRVQLGGYNAEGGNAVLNVTSTAIDSDPRQEGPIQVSGNLTVGGSATIAVAVKNYGTVATPAIHPFVDGTNPAAQAWRANSPQPTSATIQPGQTVTFTLQQPLATPGSWTTTAVSLWNDSTGALLKALPANGQSQQVGFSVSMSCGTPRPKITMQTAPTGDGRLAVQLTAGASESGNRLTEIQFGPDARTPNPNALIDLPGIGNGRTAPTTAKLTNSPVSYTFYIKRQSANVPVTLPLTVTDYCGTWQTVVGAGVGTGSGAGF